MPKLARKARLGLADERGLTAALCGLLAAWPDEPALFRARWRQIADPAGLLRLAARHGVLGVLRAPLHATEELLAPELRQVTEERLLAERLWQEQVLAAHRAPLAALESAGIRAAVLKGPILSERLYGDWHCRRSTDVDLLIAPADLERALAALATCGYQRETGPSTHYHERYHHHLALYGPLRPLLELHLRLLTGFGVVLSAEEFLPRCQPYQSATGLSCWVLAPVDELLHLCVHAAGHEFERLAWLYDLKLLLHRHPPDWAALFHRAASCGVAVPLAFTLEVLHRRLGVQDTGAKPWLTAYRPRWQTAARLLGWLESWPGGSRRAKLAALLFQAALCDRPSASLWFLQHHLLRLARRRLQRAAPRLLPAHWAG